MLFKNIHFILVRPQLGENIGAAARSLKNFNFENLRLVSPRDSWPNKSAVYTAVEAKDIVHKAKLFTNRFVFYEVALLFLEWLPQYFLFLH